jgi:hypothetical protein
MPLGFTLEATCSGYPGAGQITAIAPPNSRVKANIGITVVLRIRRDVLELPLPSAMLLIAHGRIGYRLYHSGHNIPMLPSPCVIAWMSYPAV